MGKGTSSLVACRGRRRIGKSTLFKEFARRDVAELELGRRLSVSHLADKTLHNRMTVVRDPDDASADRVVRRDAVRDLTSAFAADGVLRSGSVSRAGILPQVTGRIVRNVKGEK